MKTPFNLQQWIAEHRDLLRPPVSNKNLYEASEDYIVMVVGGPNARRDFHYNQTEELFYQLEGDISIYIQEEGLKKEIRLTAGDMFLLPAGVPHSPARSEGSVGLVIERRREGKGYQDGLLWFCPNCNHKLHEVYFELHNIETDFLPHFQQFYQSESLLTCQQCGTIHDTDPRFVR